MIELVLGMMASAVLVVTLSVMLFYGYTTWVRNSQAVDLHRDATLAMQVMGKSLRQASAAGVDLSQPAQIVVSNQNTSILCSFYQQSGNLVYNPDVNGGGTPFLLVQGRLMPSGFTHSNINHGVTIRLKLQQGTESLEMNGSVCFRN
ncbi:MAG: hypothetical protein WCL16_01625 [bacterium]